MCGLCVCDDYYFGYILIGFNNLAFENQLVISKTMCL